MRGIAHAHVLSVAGRVAFWLGQHGPAERAVQTAYYWEWLRAGPTDTDDDKDGADAPGWHAHALEEEIADWMESHEEWAALVPEKKAQLLGRLHELCTEDGLDHLQGRAEQLWDSYELLDPILEVIDHEIEHLTEPWLEMVVLDQLCEELSDNNIWDLPPELERASSPASSMETPAPAEEARADAVADALEADALEADAPSSADSESEVEADADTVRPRAAAAWAAGLWPSGGCAPPSEAELVALYARARAASPAGLSIREVHAALVLEPALRHLTLADVKKANSKALKGGLLTAPGASADARGGAGEDGGSNRGTSASGASTHEARAADVPRRLSRLEDHVQQAFRNFEKTVGATEAECRKYGARLDAKTRVALKAMSVEPTARNYALGTKAHRLVEEEAKTKGVVSDDMVYWYMAVMYAEDQKLGRAERMLADFETPSARDVEKVRGHILREFGAK